MKIIVKNDPAQLGKSAGHLAGRIIRQAIKTKGRANIILATGTSQFENIRQLTTEEIETLSNDPPLPFFVLFEAMQQPSNEGLCLGPLGSILVSEVIFSALAGDLRAASGDALAEQLAAISREFYPANVLQDIADISSMAQLVEFTTEIAELRQAVPAFL